METFRRTKLISQPGGEEGGNPRLQEDGSLSGFLGGGQLPE